MNRIIKKSAFRLFAVAKALLLVSSCFMVSNLWAMEQDNYRRATLINKTGSAIVVTTYFSFSPRFPMKKATKNYFIQKGEEEEIPVKHVRQEGGWHMATIGVTLVTGNAAEIFFNAGNEEEIKARKSYTIKKAEKIVPLLEEVKQ